MDTGTEDTTLASIPITMVVDGGYFRIVDFFRRLEVEVPRAVLVESVSVEEQQDAGFPTLRATWTGQMFAVLPAEDVGTAGGAPAAPQATPTPTPTPAPTEGGES